jgi:hypothetical protein
MTAQFYANQDKYEREKIRQERVDAINERDYIRQMEARKEARLEEQMELAMRRLRAESRAAVAKLEEDHFKSKDYAIGMLSKLGALRTDSGAIVGLENLDAKYNTAIADTKREYSFKIAEMQSDVEYKIWESTSKFNYDTMKITQDLNKSQREVDMDLYKLQFNFQKDSMKLKKEIEDNIKKENEKYYNQIMKNNTDYQKKLFELTTAGGVPYEIALTLLAPQKDGFISPTKENIDLYNQYYKKGTDLKPKVTGQTLKTNISSKQRKKLFENFGMDENFIENIAKALEANFSLEQIVENTNRETPGIFPASAYTYFKNNLLLK